MMKGLGNVWHGPNVVYCVLCIDMAWYDPHSIERNRANP